MEPKEKAMSTKNETKAVVLKSVPLDVFLTTLRQDAKGRIFAETSMAKTQKCNGSTPAVALMRVAMKQFTLSEAGTAQAYRTALDAVMASNPDGSEESTLRQVIITGLAARGKDVSTWASVASADKDLYYIGSAVHEAHCMGLNVAPLRDEVASACRIVAPLLSAAKRAKLTTLPPTIIAEALAFVRQTSNSIADSANGDIMGMFLLPYLPSVDGVPLSDENRTKAIKAQVTEAQTAIAKKKADAEAKRAKKGEVKGEAKSEAKGETKSEAKGEANGAIPPSMVNTLGKDIIYLTSDVWGALNSHERAQYKAACHADTAYVRLRILATALERAATRAEGMHNIAKTPKDKVIASAIEAQRLMAQRETEALSANNPDATQSN